MKKSFYFLFFLLGATLCSMAQDYTVLHVTGKIYRNGTTAEVHAGDQLNANEILDYPGQSAWSIVIDEKGIQSFIQQPGPRDTIKNVQKSLHVIEKTAHPVTRDHKGPVENLRKYFAGEQFVFIGDDFYLEVDPKNYPLDEKIFLLYRYDYNSRTITHKIPQTKQVIHFNKPFLYEYKGDSIPYMKTWNTELTLFNSNTNLPGYVAGFRPIWLNEDELKKELLLLQKVSQRQKMSRTELKKVFLQYVQDVYGKTDEIIFMDWVDKKVLRK